MSGAKNSRMVWIRSMSLFTASIIAGLLTASSTHAEDWSQWRGAERLGLWNETGILDQFPKEGLKVEWRTPIHEGYSGPVVAKGRVFVTDRAETPETHVMEGTERIMCLDEKTGKPIWEVHWKASYAKLMASYATGPRASPTVDDDRVYALGALGMLMCVKIDTGAVIWKKDFVEDYKANIPTWGATSSPLVDGNKLICIVGAEPDGKVMAFDKMTGKEIWRSLPANSDMGYGQPIIIKAGDARQLIIWHPKALCSLDPETGKVNWEEAWDVGAGMSVATPVQSGNYLFVSQFYRGSLMMQLDLSKPAATKLWVGKSTSEAPDKTDGLHSLITTPIIEGDYIYGVCSYGQLRCLNAKTGERVWASDKMTRQGRWGAAFLVKNGDRYFVNNDTGDLIIAKFSPKGYEEISRTKLIEPTSHAGFGPRRTYEAMVNWSHPAYADKHIFARNDKEIISASLEK